MFGSVSGKCVLWFLGGVAVGVVAGVAVSRGKLNVRPLATDILSSGLSLRDKVMSKVEGVKEDLADAVAEARVKNQEGRCRSRDGDSRCVINACLRLSTYAAAFDGAKSHRVE